MQVYGWDGGDGICEQAAQLEQSPLFKNNPFLYAKVIPI